MATRTANLAQTNSSDANFRLWINEIHNGLIAFGWLQTSDTGQINFSTVLRPAAINTYQGYAVYKMNDSLQSSCACFMRLDFGTGNQTDVPAFKLQLTVGGTDGAGTLTGIVGTQQTLSGNVSNATLFNVRSSGTSSSYRMSFWEVVGGGGGGFMFVIERDRDSSGAETANGINTFMHWIQGGSAQIMSSQFIPVSGALGDSHNNCYALISTNAAQTAGGNTGIAPVRIQYGPLRNPMMGILIFARGDFGMETTNSVTIYGSAHTYMMFRPFGGTSAAARNMNVINGDCGYALLWE